MNQSTLLLSVIAVAALPCRLPAAADLNIEFSDRGLASIVHNGVELLAANNPGFRLRDLNFVDSQAKDGNRQVTEWIQDARDPVRNALRSQAAEALARAGDAAVPALVALLESKNAGVWPHAIRALGRTGTTELAARQALTGFLGDDLPQKRQLHVAAVEALGLLRVKEAVPALVAILDKRDRDSEDLRGAAVVALGRIGDAHAVQPLIKQFDVGYSTVVVYWIRDAIDAALRSLTGEQAIVGAEEWKAWSAGKR